MVEVKEATEQGPFTPSIWVSLHSNLLQDFRQKFFVFKFWILKNEIHRCHRQRYIKCVRPFFDEQETQREKKPLLRIYAVVNQVKLRPKEMISMFVT